MRRMEACTRNKNVLFIALLALALPVLAGLAPLYAQDKPQENAFDYIPGAGEQTNVQPAKPMVEVSLEDVNVTNDPVYGIIVTSKHRWRDWVERSLYLTLLAIAILAITASLSTKDEATLIIAYFLSGVSFTLALWISFCSLLLFELKSAAGLYILPVSVVLGAITYFLLMRIKKADVSLSELKDSFKGPTGGEGSDQRLASIDGSPGDWQEEDFIR